MLENARYSDGVVEALRRIGESRNDMLADVGWWVSSWSDGGLETLDGWLRGSKSAVRYRRVGLGLTALDGSDVLTAWSMPFALDRVDRESRKGVPDQVSGKTSDLELETSFSIVAFIVLS